MTGGASTSMLYEPLARDEVVAAGNEAIWQVLGVVKLEVTQLGSILQTLSSAELGALADGGAPGDPWLWGGLASLPWSSRWRSSAKPRRERRLR